MATTPMQRLMTAALVLGTFAGAASLGAQGGAGGTPASPPAPPATRVDDAELARDLAREQALRMQLVARIEALAARLDDTARLGGAERRRLQQDLELTMRRLTETHARAALDVGSRIIIDRRPSIASDEVRRMLGATQRRLTSAARTGFVGITLSPTSNHVRVEDSGELFVRYFDHPAIISVEPDSPAERAGLRRGDVVLAYNGEDVRRELPMHEVLKAGNRVKVRVRRDGRERTVNLTVASAPANVLGRRTDFLVSPSEMIPRTAPPAVRTVPRAAPAPGVAAAPASPEPRGFYRFELVRGIAGAELTPITDGLASALGVRRGLLVMRVAPRSAAATAGLRDGDIVLRADGRVVEDIAALSRVMREHDAARTVTLETQRAKKKRTVRLRW